MRAKKAEPLNKPCKDDMHKRKKTITIRIKVKIDINIKILSINSCYHNFSNTSLTPP